MNTSPRPIERKPVLRNNLRNADNIVQKLPDGAVLTTVLKTIEIQLQKRGLLPITPLDAFNPVWFLAETERNIFLWRKGLSLDTAKDFEFWVDIPSLLSKRLRQLESGVDENPFINPLWGTGIHDEQSKQREINYIQSFKELLSKIHAHAHALSQVGALLEEELLGESAAKKVVLP